MKTIYLRTIVVFVISVFLSGCSLFDSGVEVEGDKPPTVVFADDFTGYAIGSFPSDWEVEKGDAAVIEVVAEAAVPTGRALHLKGVNGPRTDAGVKGLSWDSAVDEATTVAIQFKVRHIRGSVNAYAMTPPTSPSVHWRINADGLLSAYGSAVSIPLEDGWNDIRVVANRASNQVYIYLNDMETPVIGPVALRAQPESWTGAQVRFSHVVDEDLSAEAYYADVKVWIID